MSAWRLAHFTADVTPPHGHPLCGGWIPAAAGIAGRLWAKGLVLLGADAPVVWCAVDWCELRNTAYDLWCETLAAAAGTTPDRVLVGTVHAHDAPLVDDRAQVLLAAAGERTPTCDLDFLAQAAQATAAALRDALPVAGPVDHYGVGRGRVAEVASTRRMLDTEGRVIKVRYSADTDAAARDYPEGVIDPWLLTLSFWHGDQPQAALSCYACHPMSYYGRGQVAPDFFGWARDRWQQAVGVPQVVFNGCAGNVAAGKYNDGSDAAREKLIESVQAGLQAAWESTTRYPLETVAVRSTALRLEPKSEPEFQVATFEATLHDPRGRFASRARAAMALSWLERVAADRPLHVVCLDFGQALVVQLPGEPFVEYQLFAQAMCPGRAVLTLAYGDGGPGYLPLAESYAAGGYEPGEWSFVAPSVEVRLREALRAVLTG